MASKIISLAFFSLLASVISASPIDTAGQSIWKRDTLAQCPGGQVPPDDGPIKACLLPAFNCPSVTQQQQQFDGLDADPRSFAIATQENSGPNCDAGQVQVPTNTKTGGSTNCGFFNNNLAAINKWCPGATCDSLQDLSAAASCMNLQIKGAGSFDIWAQYQRCGHPCGDSQGEACGDPSKGVQCTSSSNDYVQAINYIQQQTNANEAQGLIGNAWLIGI